MKVFTRVAAMLACLWILVGIDETRAQDTSVDIANTTGDTVAVIQIGPDTQQQLLVEIPAGTTQQLLLPVGTTLGFAQAGAWLGDGYVTTGAPGESLAVPYSAQASGPIPESGSASAAANSGAAQVQITNGSDQPVVVVAIAADQTQQALKQLAPGETYAQPATPGTTLGFAQNDSWLGDGYVVTGAPGEAVTLPYFAQAAGSTPDNQNLMGGGQQQLSVTNGSSQPVVVVGIAADQAQQALKQLAPGETAAISAAPGLTLGFAQADAWLGDAYVVKGTPGEAVTVPYSAAAAAPIPPGSVQGEMKITNNSAASVTIIAIGADQSQSPLGEVAPGETRSQAIVPDMTLGFAQGEAWLGDPYVTTGAPGQAIELPYRRQGPVTEEFIETDLPMLAITNSSDQPVLVLSIQPENVQVPLKEIPAGETYMQPASSGITFGFAQGTAWLGDFYVTTGDFGEAVTVPYRAPTAMQIAQRGPDSVEITFDNTSGSPLTVAALNDTGQAEPIYDLQPGQSAERALPGTKLWFYKAGEDAPTGDPFVVGEELRQQVTLPFDARAALVAQHEGPGSVALEFTNTNVVPIMVTLVDAENKATPLYEIPPGQIVTRRALPKSTLYFFRQGEENPVADYFVVPETEAALSLPYYYLDDLRRQQAGPGSITLEVRNETLVDVDVVVAGRGRPADLYTIPFANSAASGRGMDIRVLPGTELFFLSKATEVVNDELKRKVEGSYTVAAGGPSIIYLPFQPEMSSQQNPTPPGAVTVKIKNSKSEGIPELVFVASTGGNAFTLRNNVESWRNLAPGTILYSYGRKNPGDAQLSLIADPFQIPTQAGLTIEVPFYKTSTMSAQDLIAAGKIDMDAIVKQITASLIQANLDSKKATVCWRDTYGRGVGTVPRNCRPGQSEDTAGLCYDNCRAGYYPFVTMCIPNCPAGFTNTGLHCLKPAPVSRDAYPWEFGDTLFSLDDARARCRRDHGNNCVTANANTIVYSTCPTGYKQAPVITSLCTPVCPAGMTDIGISCQKNTYDRGVGQLMICDSSKENDAGLCYDRCRSGFSGVGPVCWAQCPANLPVNCGASCAKDKGACALAITDQITTPLMTAANIALIALTAGAGAGATGAANAGKAGATTAAKTGASVMGQAAAKEVARQGLKAAVKAALRAGLQTAIKSTAGMVAKDMAIDAAVGAVITGAFTIGFSEKAKADIREALKKQIQQQLANNITDAQIDSIVNAAMEGSSAGSVDFQWTSIDPTGIAEIVRSYNLPLCSQLK